MNIPEVNIFLTEAVELEQKAMRLDKFLVLSFPEMSRSQLQRLTIEGNVSLDDDVVIDNALKVKVGDVYQVFVPPSVEAEPEPEDITLDVVYEDEDLVVVNKPAGMTVHPAAGAYSGTLVNALLYHCRNSLSGIGGVKRPGIVHRIDKDTSGLLVAAKNDATHRNLCEQFAEHSVDRQYLAVVYGVPHPLKGKIEGNIGRSPYDRKKMAMVAKGGKNAITNYEVLEIFENAASLVRCKLETGRTHQIRVHFASLGCNLIGDQVYEKHKKSSIKFKSENAKKMVNSFARQALHAKTLGFVHPTTGNKMQFDSCPPKDMEDLLQALRNP